MSNAIEEDASWGAKMKKALDAKTIVVALAVLGYIGEKAWGWMQVGAKAEFEIEVESTFTGDAFEDAVDSLFLVNAKKPENLDLILESEEVKKFSEKAGKEIHDQIVENVTKNDSNKISMRAFVGASADIRDDAVLPLLAELLKEYKAGNLMTKRQADAYVSRKIKSMVDRKALKETPSF